MPLSNNIVIGKKYTFRYPKEFVTLPEYTARAGSAVTVERQLTQDEADQADDMEAMYRVKADDGWEGDAFASELDDNP